MSIIDSGHDPRATRATIANVSANRQTAFGGGLHLFRRTAPSISRLTLDTPDGKREVLSVTSEHPFFVEGKGLLEVRRLQKGDRVVSEKNALLAVADIAHDEKPTLVYNFEVAQDHNYFVGDLGAEAHNMRFGPDSPSFLYKLTDYAGNLLKWGITSRALDERYSRPWLERNGCRVAAILTKSSTLQKFSLRSVFRFRGAAWS